MTKIIDIIPPRSTQNEAVRVVKKPEPSKNKKVPKILFAFLIFIIIGFGTAYFVEGSASVVIYPVVRDVSLEETIYIKAEETEINLAENILPGEYFEETLNFEDTYSATGSDESATKSSGFITVCNEHPSNTPLKLVKNTRFLSAEGELTYKALAAFTVPAKSGNTPGCVEVEVIADEAGEDYNLNTGTFSIPGLNNTDYYTTVWGELKDGQKIEGGSRSTQRVVTEKDLAKATDLFEEKYLEIAKQSLISNLEKVGTYLYFDDGFKQDFDKFIVLGSEGDKVENFKIQATITTKVLILRKADVDKYIAGKLLLTEENREFVPESLSKEFLEAEGNTDGTILVLKVVAQTYSKISEVLILNDVKGQEIEDCLSILKKLPEIESADVTASLFWKDRLPKNKENINIEFNFAE